MKIKKFETKEDWLDGRKSKITGSRLKDIVVKRGTGEKIAYYEIIAERICTLEEEENPMDRGTRLEQEGIEKLQDATGKEFDTSLVLWEREDNNAIAISPDGFNGSTIAAEIKCLSSAKHIESYLTKKIPEEYTFQKLQYFIVNEELETLYFGFYDPRMPKKLELHYFVIERKDVQEDVDMYLAYQKEKLEKIEEIITELTF